MRAENLLCRRARATYAVSESLGSDHRRSFLWPIRPLTAQLSHPASAASMRADAPFQPLPSATRIGSRGWFGSFLICLARDARGLEQTIAASVVSYFKSTMRRFRTS